MTKPKKASASPALNSSFAEHFRAHVEVVAKSGVTLESSATAACRAIIEALEGGGKIICFGNGGSATQASHWRESSWDAFARSVAHFLRSRWRATVGR
jgi:phosphoheptose isomerase